jgi:hypothetical protein
MKERFMVDNAQTTPAPEKAKVPKKQPTHKEETHKKNAWSLERCTKAASRYTNADDWKKGAPSSYKAAQAHGWYNECCKHLQAPARKPMQYKKSA